LAKEIPGLYQKVYAKIKEGNIVYSRLDRFKKKGAQDE